jgi:hypothetical protein
VLPGIALEPYDWDVGETRSGDRAESESDSVPETCEGCDTGRACRVQIDPDYVTKSGELGLTWLDAYEPS